MKYTLPELPYDLDALEPHISRETLQFHYGKHHATYVDKLNNLIEDTPFADKSLEDIVREADGDIFNNAAQVWNHNFYWECLSPDGGGSPEGQLARAIERGFGSFDVFLDRFNEAATKLFGSGWVWLTATADGTLEIESTQNADTPIRRGKVVLLTCDVWEHAYYIDHRNSRADYMTAFWKLMNWKYAAKQLEFTHSEERRRA